MKNKRLPELSRLALGCLALVVLAACLDGAACNQITNPGPPVPTPTASPTPSPSPTASTSTCPEVALVGVQVLDHPNPLVVGNTYRLDATPKDDEFKKIEDPRCHGKTVAWSLEGSTAICQLTGQTEGFNPFVNCSTPGQLVATACVTAPGGCGSVTVTVVRA